MERFYSHKLNIIVDVPREQCLLSVMFNKYGKPFKVLTVVVEGERYFKFVPEYDQIEDEEE